LPFAVDFATEDLDAGAGSAGVAWLLATFGTTVDTREKLLERDA